MRSVDLCRGLFASSIALAVFAGTASTAHAVGKAHQILMDRGLQVQGMVTKDDGFHLQTYKNANYNTINWLWTSDFNQLGAEQSFPWARWVHDETEMPTAGAELAHRDSLVALQLGDEWNLNDAGLRQRAVDWFNSVRSQYPNTILYMNNYGGQVNDAALDDFVNRAHPDMLSFDSYPYKSDYVTRQPNQPTYGSPTSWYGDLRRYRIFALNAQIPLAVYRQTFHAVQDYDQTVYRDPSQSEQNLNTFGALAFGATYLMDFTYNTGASSLFTQPGGDSNPNAAYTQHTLINQRARNMGKALTHLKPIHDAPSGANFTTDIMFLRGKTGPNPTDVTPLPVGFTPDDAAPNTFSEWSARANDPYMAGFIVTNLGTRNAGLRGDAIISWFKPLDDSLDNPADADDQLYFMITNAFTGPDGGDEEYRQRIQINFFADVTPSVQWLNPDTGLIEVIDLEIIPSSGGRRKLLVELDGGMSGLFKFNTGDPFVGVPEPASLSLLCIGGLLLSRRTRI